MKRPGNRQLIMYLLSAGATGAIYTVLLFITGNLLKANPYISVSAAYAAAMVFYFVTNKLVVFRNTGQESLLREVLGFLPLAAVNYVLTLGIVAIISRYTGEVYSGSVVAGIVTTVLTYLVFDKLLFKNKTRPDPARA